MPPDLSLFLGRQVCVNILDASPSHAPVRQVYEGKRHMVDGRKVKVRRPQGTSSSEILFQNSMFCRFEEHPQSFAVRAWHIFI